MPRPLRVLAYPPERRRHDPYTARLHEALAAEGIEVDDYSRVRAATGRYDIASVHHVDFMLYPSEWRRAAYRSVMFIALLRWARLRGAKVVWTVHNLDPHELRHQRLARWYFRRLATMADGFVSLSPSGVTAIEARHPGLAGKPHAVVPLGHHRGEYPDDITRSDARDRLGIDGDSRVVVFLGQIRPYKGVDELVRVFTGLDDPHAVLLVAGQPVDDRIATELAEAAAPDPRVRLHLGFVEAEDIQVYLRAADLAVIPFRRIFNSSSALLALSFDVPVLVPDLGAMRDVQASVGKDWVRLYDGALDTDTLARELGTPSRGTAPLDAHEWPAIGAATAAFYRSLRNERGDVLP